jgi:lysozyme family protein
MLGNFIRCCGFTLVQEGGFCNVQGDPGGATNHGITMATLSNALGRPANVQEIVFDFGVNTGPGRSVQRLCRAYAVIAQG